MCSRIELSAFGRRVGVRYVLALCGSSKTTCSLQVWPRSTRVKRMHVLPQESHASSQPSAVPRMWPMCEMVLERE